MISSMSVMSMAGCAAGMSVSSDGEEGTRTVAVGPGAGGGGARAAAGGLDRTRVPPVGAPSGLDLPEAVSYTLDNGVRVVLVERHALPLVAFQLTFPGGASAHSPVQAGLAALTADMLDEGTTTRTALEISDAMDHLGASFSTTAGYDASTLRLSVLRPRLEEAVGLLADLVLNPSVPEDELERVRQERLGRILQRRARPDALADEAFARTVYGAAHPYGVPLLGTEAGLGALTRDDVVAFHRARYLPGQATLVVVGDVTRTQLDSLLADAFGGWRGAGEAAPTVPPPAAGGAPRVVVVDRPGAAQSEIRVGRVGVARDTDRFFALQVANTVLGGSFTSRLNANLREEKGYTYGAGSWFDLRRAPGPFEAATAVETEVTAAAVAEILGEMARMGEEPVPGPELDRARQYLARRLPQRFETVEDVVSRLADLAFHGLPLDFYDGYVAGVLGVDAAAVRQVGRELMAPGGMVVVVAGDAARIAEPLRALGVGPVEVLPAGGEG